MMSLLGFIFLAFIINVVVIGSMLIWTSWRNGLDIKEVADKWEELKDYLFYEKKTKPN